MTNGEKIKEIFPSAQITECESYIQVMGENYEFNNIYSKKWWNAKYKEPKMGHYEKHIDHTDCIWYGSDEGCPVTCSQYRDGWNDAMDYIFKNGKGYQPYRHDG